MKKQQSFVFMLAVLYFKERNDLSFYNFFTYLNEQVTLKKTDWGITDPEAASLDDVYDIYKPLYDAITNKKTRNSQQVDDHRTGRDTAEKFIEGFANEFIISNSKISKPLCETLGFNKKSDQRTERPVISKTVFAEMKPMPGSRIQVTCRTQTDASRASILDIADEVEVRYALTPCLPPGRIAQIPSAAPGPSLPLSWNPKQRAK
jgi:hypothetical protein